MFPWLRSLTELPLLRTFERLGDHFMVPDPKLRYRHELGENRRVRSLTPLLPLPSGPDIQENKPAAIRKLHLKLLLNHEVRQQYGNLPM